MQMLRNAVLPGECRRDPYVTDSCWNGWSEAEYNNRGQMYRLGEGYWWGATHLRHMDGANVLYGDGHVEHRDLTGMAEYKDGWEWGQNSMFFNWNITRAANPAVLAADAYLERSPQNPTSGVCPNT